MENGERERRNEQDLAKYREERGLSGRGERVKRGLLSWTICHASSDATLD